MTAAQRMDAGGTNDLWHYAVGSERKGPVPRTTIAKLLASGEISAETYVWQPGMDNWVHLVDAAPLKPLVAGLEGDGHPEEFVEEDTAFTSPADLKAVHTALDDDGEGELSGDTIVEAIPDMSKGAAAPAVQETGPRGTQKSPKKGGAQAAQAEAKPAAKVAAPAAKVEPAKQLATATMAAQPAPAPAKKDSGLFSNVAAPAAAASSSDIFGGGSAADDDIFGSSAPAAEGEDIAGVHGRRQSSVLFSLDELGREESKKGGGGGKPGGNEQFVTDSSGLIDIKAIATNEKRGSSGDDPFGASAPNLVLPSRSGPAAMTIPIVERKRGNGPWILAAAALLVIGGAVVAFILATGGDKEVTNVPVASNEPPKTEPAKPVEAATDKKVDEAKVPPTEAKVDPAANPTPPTEAKVDPAANPTPPPTEAKVDPATNPAVVAKKDEPKKDEVKKDEPKKDEVKKDPPPNKENTTKVNDLLDKLNSGDPVKKDEGGGDSSLPDKLSAATVRNTIKGRFGRCGGMISNPSGSVTVQTQFVISASGVVQSARVSDGGGTSPDVQRCVVSVIKETTFGKFKEPTMQVNLPVRLL